MLGLLKERRRSAVFCPPKDMQNYTATYHHPTPEEDLNREFSFLEKLADSVTVCNQDNLENEDENGMREESNEQMEETQSCSCDNSGPVTCAHTWYAGGLSEPQTPEVEDVGDGLLLCNDELPDNDENDSDNDDDDDDDDSDDDEEGETNSVCSSGSGRKHHNMSDIDEDEDERVPPLPHKYSLQDFVKDSKEESDDNDDNDNDSDNSSSTGTWVSDCEEMVELPPSLPPVPPKSSRKREAKAKHEVKSRKYKRQGGMMVPVKSQKSQEEEAEEEHWDNLDTFLQTFSSSPCQSQNSRRSRKYNTTSFGNSCSDSDDYYYSFTGRPEGSTLGYAFPRTKPDDIDDVICVWEMDFQVGDKIAPKMSAWETMGIVPDKTVDKKAWRRYVSYKNLYIKYLQCNKCKNTWFNKYWCKSLPQILLQKSNTQGNKRRADEVAHKGNYRSVTKTVSYKKRLNHSCSIENDMEVNKEGSVIYGVCV